MNEESNDSLRAAEAGATPVISASVQVDGPWIRTVVFDDVEMLSVAV